MAQQSQRKIQLTQITNPLLSIEWNSIRLSDPAHGIVTKTVHKTLPGGGGGQGVLRVRGGGGGQGVSSCYSIDQVILPME